MAIGERIRYFRKLRNMTQKELGCAVGFDESTADIRIAQYEAGTRTPKADLAITLASALDVSHAALNVPDIDSAAGLLHTLFALEDLHRLKIDETDGAMCLRFDNADALYPMLCAWREQAAKLDAGSITRQQYDQWRYSFPTNTTKITKQRSDKT